MDVRPLLGFTVTRVLGNKTFAQRSHVVIDLHRLCAVNMQYHIHENIYHHNYINVDVTFACYDMK